MTDFLRALLVVMLVTSICILGYWASHLPEQAELLRNARARNGSITAEQQRPAWTRLRIEQATVWTLIAVCSLGVAALVRGHFQARGAATPAPRRRLSTRTVVFASLVTLLFGFLILPFILQISVTTSSGFKHVVQVSVVEEQGNRPVAQAKVVATFTPDSTPRASEWTMTDREGRCEVTAYFGGSTRTTRFSRSGTLSASGWLVVKADGFEIYRRRLQEFFSANLEWNGSPPKFVCTAILSRHDE